MTTAPPPAQAQRAWIIAKVEDLKSRPGEWEVVRTVPNHRVASPLRQRLKELGAGAVARNNPDGTVDVWAAWKPKSLRATPR